MGDVGGKDVSLLCYSCELVIIEIYSVGPVVIDDGVLETNSWGAVVADGDGVSNTTVDRGLALVAPGPIGIFGDDVLTVWYRDGDSLARLDNDALDDGIG